jgi:hypothetical protein
VKGEPAALAHLDRPAPHGDPLTLRIDLAAEGGHFAVHPHPPVLDQLLRGTAGRDAGPGERALEPHLAHDSAST